MPLNRFILPPPNSHLQATTHLFSITIILIFQVLYNWNLMVCQSVSQFSCSVMSDSLWPHESQYARLPCPSPTPGVHPNSCASSQWCHPAISSSVILFSCPQSLLALESFPIRWPKYWSFSLSISPSNEHPGLVSFRMDWLDLLAVQGTLKSLLQHHSSKASILQHAAFFTVQLSCPYNFTNYNDWTEISLNSFISKSSSLCWGVLCACSNMSSMIWQADYIYALG